MKFTGYISAIGLLVTSLTSQAQTPQFTSIALVNPTLVASPNGALKPGAVYRYDSAGGGNFNYIDAYITITHITNDHGLATSNNDSVGLFAFDNLANVNNPGGYDSSFQPVVSSSYTNSSGLWTASQSCNNGNVSISHSADQNYLVHFRISFKKHGTQNDTALNVYASFIDIDGFGTGTEAEQDAFMPGVSYQVDPNSTLTLTQRADGLINAEGQPANVPGVELTQTASITQVTYLYRPWIDFAMGMNTHSANTSGYCYSAVSGGRLKSVSFAAQPIGLTTTTPTIISLSGTVWNDKDGSAAGTFINIQSTGEVGTDGWGLYVYALDSATNTVISRVSVNSNGSWSISDVPKDIPLKLILTNTLVAVGVTNGAPGNMLNSNWVATSPLSMPSLRTVVSVSGLDFGIEQKPTSASYSVVIPTPALNATKALTTANGLAPLSGTDPEDGSLGQTDTVKIINVTGLNGNKLYYNGTLIAANTVIYEYTPSLLTIKFTGAHSVSASFTFQFRDSAGVAGNIATYTINWGTALPIKLINFNAARADKQALLTWTLITGQDNGTTNVQRSSDGVLWTTIGHVANQVSSETVTYDFTDATPLMSGNFYRLQIANLNDNSLQYSQVYKLNFSTNESEIQFAPNPVLGTLYIKTNSQTNIASLHIINASGREIYQGVPATNTIDMSSFPAGQYWISITDVDGRARKFSISKL